MARSIPVRLLVSAIAISTAVACGEHASPTSPSQPSVLASRRSGNEDNVAECVIPFDYNVSARIGPRGGKLELGRDNALVFPPGALLRETTITAHVPAGHVAKVQFAPEGLTFVVPASLTMSYSACITPTLGVKVVYLRADSIVEVEPSVSNPRTQTVTATISHFSSYAVAY
jgi:hypothetical protein